jgi:integrase
MRVSSSRTRRRRVGGVTLYPRGRRFWVYYRQGGEVIRRAVGVNRSEALALAARINAELAQGAPASLAFRRVEIAGLIAKWLDHHEQVRRSSLATVRRYGTAIRHLGDFVASRYGKLRADRFTTGMAEEFVRHLRTIQVAPNGHPNAAPRALRDKGVVFVLQACRALFGFATKQRHLPAYAQNPFSGLAIERMPIEDAKPIRPLTSRQEVAFFQACDAWQFPISSCWRSPACGWASSRIS